MIFKEGYKPFSIIKLAGLTLLLVVFPLIMLFFSLKIEGSLSTYLYWFVIISRVFYVILLLFYLFNLYLDFNMYFNKGRKDIQKDVLDEYSVKNNITLSPNNRMKNIILNLDSKCEKLSPLVSSLIREDGNIFTKECFYEHIPLPTVVTNNDGIVLVCNELANSFFNQSLINHNISEFIEFIEIYNIKSCDIINVKLLINKSNYFITSIVQKSIFDENQKLKLVIIFFLPGTINKFITNKVSTLPSNTTEINVEKINNNHSCIENVFNIDEMVNILNIGLIILDKEHNIVLLNNKVIDFLKIIEKHNFTRNLYKPFLTDVKCKHSNITIEKLIGSNFQCAFKHMFDNKSILDIINNKNGVNKLEINDLLYIEIRHTLVKNHIIINLLDISEKRKLELQNSFAQRLQTIGQIASAVAHDFNNLLTAIMSFTYFLKERYSEEDPSSLELEQIEQNANRAKVMIRQLLTFSRSKELNPTQFLVNSEISNLMSTILRLMGERIKTEFVRGRNIGKITMDPVQFQQVIINLVVNARDAMKNGGKLIISTNLIQLKQPLEAVMATIPPGDYIVISVKDQGEGIRKENFKKIFQTHFSTKGDKGNGLGLSTVAKIMQENSGFIALDSKLDEGTTFYLYFSIGEVNVNIVNKARESTVLQNNNNTHDITLDLTGSGTILLVEDEIPVRTVCKRALVNKGYQVIEAEDAETALSLLQNLTNKIDLIISDIMMPGISGLEFIAEAKKIHPKLKAILMSGYAEDTLEANHYTLDSIEFLAKPFSPDVLATKVKKVINS